MFRSLLVAMVIAMMFVARAHAALIGYDGFSYTAGTLSGKGLPTDPGFSTSWTQSGANGANVVATGLSYGSLDVSGGAADLAGAGTTLNFRGLNNVYDAPADSSTGEIWWSYLIKPGAYTGIPFAGLSFYTDAISGVAAADTDFATATRDSSGLKYGFSDLDVTTNFFTTTVVPTNGITTLIVGRLILDGGTNSGANDQDRIHLYVNPAIGGAAPASDGNANVTANFRTIRFASSGGAPFTVDEFRFGESFADVTPVVPEPSTCCILVSGLVAIHLFRRTRTKTTN